MSHAKQSLRSKLLALVLSIIVLGALASFAVPRWAKDAVRNQQINAKGMLDRMMTRERWYYLTYGKYLISETPADSSEPNAFQALGVSLNPRDPYQYSMYFLERNDGDSSLVIQAIGNLDKDSFVDIWTIDENFNIRCQNNDLE